MNVNNMMEDGKSVEGEFVIRYATKDDAELIVYYIRELAIFEGDLEEVAADVTTLEKYMFDERGAEALICEYEGNPIGFAFFFSSFSTFTGKPGILLGDLYIEPEMRNRGFGLKTLKRLAEITKERDCARLEWWVHDWNHDAARFYRKHGAEMVKDIRVYRLDGRGLDDFAE